MLFEQVDRVLPWAQQPEVVYECRHCGTSVDKDTEACPTCGSKTIATYRIS
jgi:DNA-directed RNA polymerase subunit RPC12/RpoP